ncbi:MAG: hypothetical protein ACXWTW_03530, partial [Methylobacter sp.]
GIKFSIYNYAIEGMNEEKPYYKLCSGVVTAIKLFVQLSCRSIRLRVVSAILPPTTTAHMLSYRQGGEWRARSIFNP